MAAAEELAAGIGYTGPACDALGVPRASLYRWRRPRTRPARPRPRSHRSLLPAEQEKVLAMLLLLLLLLLALGSAILELHAVVQ